MEILNEKYVRIHFDETISAVVLKWDGFVNSQKFKHAILVMLEFIKKNKDKSSIKALLADTRKLEVVNKENVDWMANEVDPMLSELGVNKAAFIVSESLFTLMSIHTFESKTIKNEQKLESRQFVEFDSAIEWLEEK